MLIDRTYFIGDINIPNADGEIVGPLVDYYINKYEPDFMRRVMGQDGYAKLLTLDVTLPGNEFWLGLLRGSGRYFGIVPTGDVSLTYQVLGASVLSFVVDTALANTATYTNAVLQGRTYSVFKSGYGVLNSTILRDDSGFHFTDGELFSLNDEYTLFLDAVTQVVTIPGVDAPQKESPIANYVYYWFMRNNITQTTTGGETKAKYENAEQSSIGHKMEKAWNEIVGWERDFRWFVKKNPGYLTHRPCFKPINEFNL